MVWSPDSKSIAFVTSDRKLFTIGADGKDQKELASSSYGAIGPGLVARRQADRLLQNRRLAIQRHLPVPRPAARKRRSRSTRSTSRNPRFSADGTKVYFVRREGDVGGEGAPPSQLFCVPLEKLTSDPNEPDPRPTEPGGPDGRRRGMTAADGHAQDAQDRLGRPQAANATGHPRRLGLQLHPCQRRPDVDLRRLRRRRDGGGGPGGGGRGGGGTPSIYTIQDNGKRMTRIATGTPRPAVADGG